MLNYDWSVGKGWGSKGWGTGLEKLVFAVRELGKVIFQDLTPLFCFREDSDSENEQRFITLGMGGKTRILIVVYTYRDETIRIISAWKANEPQRRRYESQF